MAKPFAVCLHAVNRAGPTEARAAFELASDRQRAMKVQLAFG